jgi:hypothetical protein
MLSVPALAQQPSKARIGYLTSSSYVHPAFADLFFGRVSIAGGMWGGSLELLSRSAAGSDDRLPSLAAELVGARVANRWSCAARATSRLGSTARSTSALAHFCCWTTRSC